MKAGGAQRPSEASEDARNPFAAGKSRPPSKAQAAFLEALERALGEGDPLANDGTTWADV